MEVKVNAIVIKSIDYKESDKILTLYSLEYGKITASIKGVRKASAKLKFASEPFCFSEYVLVEKNGRYTVKNATYIETFYNLRLNVEKYYTASIILEFLSAMTEEKVQDAQIFKIALDGVKNICYEQEERQSLAVFLIKAVETLGYSIENVACHDCGQIISGRVFFSFENAQFSCEECRKEGFSEIMRETYLAYFNLKEGKAVEDVEAVNKVIRFLVYYMRVKTDTYLKSSEELFKLTN